MLRLNSQPNVIRQTKNKNAVGGGAITLRSSHRSGHLSSSCITSAWRGSNCDSPTQSIVSSTSSMALAACLMAAPLLGVVLPPPALAAVDSANVILEYQALEDKGQLDSPKALNDFRSKYNVKRTTDGRVMLKSSEDKWFTVRLDLDVGGTMLMRDPDGKMYAMQTEYLKQVDLSDDYIVLLMFADGEWEQGMFPLVPEDTEEPMNLSEKDFRQVMGLLDEVQEE